MRAPCKGCTDRSPACWGSCEKYKTWMDVIHAGIAEDRKYNDADGYRRENIDKRKKKAKRL